MTKPAVNLTIKPQSAKTVERARKLRLVETDADIKRDRPCGLRERKEADTQAEEEDLWDNVPI